MPGCSCPRGSSAVGSQHPAAGPCRDTPTEKGAKGARGPHGRHRGLHAVTMSTNPQSQGRASRLRAVLLTALHPRGLVPMN